MRAVPIKVRPRLRHEGTRVPARAARRWARSWSSAASEGRVRRRRHRAVYSRGYLPHIDTAGMAQGITFRLADSVPDGLTARWREEIRLSQEWQSEDARHQELHRRVAHCEDAGWGECHLRRPEIAALVCGALLRFDGERYLLREWCVMPNHVHVLLIQCEGFPLAEIVKSWKAYTARRANDILGRRGPFWMRDYYDRIIRNQRHQDQAAAYIRNNPVKAGLCERPQDWPWSSAGWAKRESSAE